ncbi:MAG: GpE family phage tail protein [Betaproteobacteria bacterium HGW-Betaproteobacteria-4]|jgi:hypothetical protein|nr:MAG: GpE family phage tail protein [Betaproteobacteria bacterium HGW-Betaproteobacteria-4]
MADIAAVFHWSLESMEAMSLEELIDWRQQAAERSPGAEQ